MPEEEARRSASIDSEAAVSSWHLKNNVTMAPMPAGHKSQTVRPAAMKCTKAFEGLAQFTSLAFMAAHKDKDFMKTA